MLTSRENKQLRALKLGRNREASGHFLAEGIRVVEDLLESAIEIRYLVAASTLEDTSRAAALLRAADDRQVPVRTVDDREFAGFAATDSPQGILAVARTPEVRIEALPLDLDPALVLVLDGVQDPGNFGTIVRSAEAFAAAGVIALSGTVDPWNPKSIRAAAGSSFRLPIVRGSWNDARDFLRRLGFRIVGASMEGHRAGPAAGSRIALVVGNEGAGLSPAVRSDLDDLIGIPTPGRAESLNVAAAAAILLYELTGVRSASRHRHLDR